MPGSADWSSLAASAEADEIKEHILTGFRDGKPFTPYVPTAPLPQPIGTVLDFGCGLGRNFPYLTTVAARVVGYDLPPMIARCRALATEPISRLEDNWDVLRTEHVDVVYACLVLQHVETDVCRAYLNDFVRMTPLVYLLTRTDSDFGASVLDLVSDTQGLLPGPCTEVDHDPATHQLRVVGSRSFEEARALGGSRHYEVLLQTRR